MPTTTLSTIAGVTVYTTEALAKTGAVDSGAALATWMAARTAALANPDILLWDGWIYIADGQQVVYCPPTGGYITHKPGPSVTGGNGAGAVWATKTTAEACMVNGTLSAAGTAAAPNTDVTFTTGGSGGTVGLTFDFNFSDGGSQPHDDATYGWAMGFVAAGCNNMCLAGLNLYNPRTFTAFCVGGDGLIITNSTVNVNESSTHSTTNFDGIHIEGPYGSVLIGGPSSGTFTDRMGNTISFGAVTITAWDDSVSIVTDEPFADTLRAANFRAPSYLASWQGGDIDNVVVNNVVLSSTYAGIRTLSGKYKIKNVLIDGLTGTCRNYFWQGADYTDTSPGYVGTGLGVGIATPVNRLGNVTWRNINVQANGAWPAQAPARLWVKAAIDYLNLDLTTCTAVSADGASTVPFFQIDKTCHIANVNFGGATSAVQTLRACDMFGRANSSTVGSPAIPAGAAAWTDVDSKFSIASDTLAMAGDGSSNTHYLVRPSGENSVNGMSVAMYGAQPGQTQFAGVALRRIDANNVYINFPVGGGNNCRLTKVVAGSGTTLITPLSAPAPATNDKLLVVGAAVNTFLVAGMYNATQGVWCAPLTTVIDSSLSSAGGFGVEANGAVGQTPTVYYVGVTTYSAAPTLTTITVTANGVDSAGRALFVAAGGSNAYAGGGIWSTSAGYIDQFGRLIGVNQGQAATVTYTVGAVSGTASYTGTGTVLGTKRVAQ